MRRAAVIFCAALLCVQAAFAATPNEMWQEYQKYPEYAATQPKKVPHKASPHITVETPQGTSAVPTAPAQAQAAAKAKQTEKSSKQAAAKQGNAQKALPTGPQQNSIGIKKADAAQNSRLLKNPPASRQFLRTPQAGDFAAAKSSAGYSVLLPRAFGSDPLTELPNAQGAMLVRIAGNTLLCAVTVLDAADTASFKNADPLPDYKGKKVYLQWQHGTAPLWRCVLSRHDDFYGDKLLLEASAEQNGKTYQALYVMPAKNLANYLPQALYSLNSMKIEA